MSKLYFLFFLVILFSCSESAKTPKDKYIRYHKNNQVEFEVGLKNKRYHGPSKSYYESGKLKQEATFMNGMRKGLQKSYYEDGKIKSTEYYKSEKLDSICTYYRNDGSLEKKIQYKYGTQNGFFKSYYENGQIYQDFNQHNGRKDGKQTAYYPDGKIKYLCYFSGGQPLEGLKEYDEQGKLKKYDYYIIVQQDNKLRLTGECTYRFKLNKEVKNVEFYTIEDENTKTPYTIPLAKKDGWFTKTFYVDEGEVLIAPLKVNAKITMNNSRQLVISKKINIALSN